MEQIRIEIHTYIHTYIKISMSSDIGIIWCLTRWRMNPRKAGWRFEHTTSWNNLLFIILNRNRLVRIRIWYMTGDNFLSCVLKWFFYLHYVYDMYINWNNLCVYLYLILDRLLLSFLHIEIILCLHYVYDMYICMYTTHTHTHTEINDSRILPNVLLFLWWEGTWLLFVFQHAQIILWFIIISCVQTGNFNSDLIEDQTEQVKF